MDRRLPNVTSPQGAVAATVGATGGSEPKRSFASRLFGYDVFLSFALGPPPRGTQSYASDLARRLREREFSVFFSEDEMPPGEVLDEVQIRFARRVAAEELPRRVVVLVDHVAHQHATELLDESAGALVRIVVLALGDDVAERTAYLLRREPGGYIPAPVASYGLATRA